MDTWSVEKDTASSGTGAVKNKRESAFGSPCPRGRLYAHSDRERVRTNYTDALANRTWSLLVSMVFPANSAEP